MRRTLFATAGVLLLLAVAAGLAAWKGVPALKRKAKLELITARRAEGLAQLERLRALAKAVEAAKPLDGDDASLPLGSVRFEKYGDPPSDGAFVDARLLSEEGFLQGSADVDFSLGDRPFWGRAIAWLETGKNPDGTPPTGDDPIEDELGRFLAVHYVGVLRTTEYRKPKQESAGSFTTGRCRFDVSVYELSDRPRLLGGFRVDAENDPALSIDIDASRRDFNLVTWLERDLRYRAYSRLHERLSARAKGVVLDPPDRYKPADGR